MELSKKVNLRKIIEKAQKIGKLEKAEIIVTVLCIILGTLLHFTYKWSGENLFVASFSSVNESVWEHLKLVFFPMLVTSIIQYFFVRKISHNYLEAKTIGIFMAILFIVVTFFTYTGILGSSLIVIDILLFIFSIILGEYVSYKLMKRKNESNRKTKILASAIILFFLSCFILFTYFTPKVNLFRDSITGLYGINKN